MGHSQQGGGGGGVGGVGQVQQGSHCDRGRSSSCFSFSLLAEMAECFSGKAVVGRPFRSAVLVEGEVWFWSAVCTVDVISGMVTVYITGCVGFKAVVVVEAVVLVVVEVELSSSSSLSSISG